MSRDEHDDYWDNYDDRPRLNLRKRLLRAEVVVGAVLLLPLVGVVAFVAVGMADQGGMGSMAEAVKLRPTVEAMPAPTASATEYNANTVAVVFPNGEWAAGVAKNSHGMFSRSNGGGTVVLKDSRGRVRCFFGHVCGGGNLHPPGVPSAEPQSLDELDTLMAKGFTEKSWP